MTRTALLVRCNADEADKIRIEAQRGQLTISRYVLDILVSAIAADDVGSATRNPTNRILSRRTRIVSGRRTAILVRYAVVDAERIREAARRRDIRINAFVLRALKSAWKQRVPLHLNIVEEPLRAAQSPGD